MCPLLSLGPHRVGKVDKKEKSTLHHLHELLMTPEQTKRRSNGAANEGTVQKTNEGHHDLNL